MGNDSISSKLQELFDLLKSGAINQEEYDLLKSQLLQKNEIRLPSSSKIEQISTEKINASSEPNNNKGEKKSDKTIIKRKKGSITLKKVGIGLFLIIFIGCAIWIILKFGSTNKPNTIQSDLYKMNLVGKVKSLTESIDNKEDDGMESNEYVKITYNFNKNRNIDNQLNFVDAKKIWNQITCSYNKDNQLIESKISFNGQNEVFKTFYLYNEQKQLIQTKQQDVNSLADTIFSYDDAGNMIKKTVHDKYAGEYYISYQFNENNQKIEERYSDGNHNNYSFKYDEKGRLVEKSSLYDVGGREFIDKVFKYKYDYKNNIINEEFGQFEFVRSKSEEQPSVWREYKYDIVYDKKGNWIKKSKSIDGKIILVQTREIEYY